jgi:thiosulfate/3-mercaptopyruvate sulfurtransferase
MTLSPLLDTATLAAMLDDPALRVFDTTVHLAPKPGGYEVRSGFAVYAEAHIPGAGFLDLLTDFADTSHRLRFMMPPRAQLIAAAGRLGIGPQTRVVLYNSGPTWWATRAFFMFRAVGFDAVQVLDGGFDRWRTEGRPIESGERSYAPTQFEPGTTRAVFVDRDAVLAAVRSGDRVLMHALAANVFRGEVAPYGRPGRIAGSVNLPAAELLGKDQRFLDRDALASRLDRVGALAERPTITYCGGGISATTNAFALLLLGREDVQIYDASMNEWGPDPALPMETG